MSIVEQLESEYISAASKWKKSRKLTNQAFYLGKMAGIETVMRKLVGDKETESMINLTGFVLEQSKKRTKANK